LGLVSWKKLFIVYVEEHVMSRTSSHLWPEKFRFSFRTFRDKSNGVSRESSSKK